MAITSLTTLFETAANSWLSNPVPGGPSPPVPPNSITVLAQVNNAFQPAFWPPEWTLTLAYSPTAKIRTRRGINFVPAAFSGLWIGAGLKWQLTIARDWFPPVFFVTWEQLIGPDGKPPEPPRIFSFVPAPLDGAAGQHGDAFLNVFVTGNASGEDEMLGMSIQLSGYTFKGP